MTENHSIEPLTCPICGWKGGACRICHPRARCPNCGETIGYAVQEPMTSRQFHGQTCNCLQCKTEEMEDWY